MHVAKTGLTAQQYKMQVIANNLANVNTTGFKRPHHVSTGGPDKIAFSDPE